MRTNTYNDEAAPWSRNNPVLGTRMLPLSDDNDQLRTEMMVNKALPHQNDTGTHL
jgi:hypothetical protein